MLVNVTAEVSGGVSGLRLQFSRPIVGKSVGLSARELAFSGTSTSSIRLRPCTSFLGDMALCTFTTRKLVFLLRI